MKIFASKTRTQTLIAAIIMIFCLIIYFHKVVFSGMVLSGTDSLFFNPPFKNYSPPGFEHPLNPSLWDQTYQFYPFLYFARENIRHGHLPLWDPYIRMGAPFLADAQSAELYPVNTVYYIFPLKIAFAIGAFIKLFLAGLGMYLFISALDVGFFGSLFSAVTFMFCAFNIVWLAWPQTNVSIFLPWLFFFISKFIKTDGLKYIAGLALVTGVQFLGGHPETSAHILLAAFVYALALLYFHYIDNKSLANISKKSSYILIAVLLGVMLASPMLLPFLSELFKSVIWISRSGTNHFFLPLSALPALLMPGFYGSPVTHNYWIPVFYGNQAGYVGIIALILALIAVIVDHKERHVLFFSSIALLSLLVVYGVPPFYQIFTKLPAFSHMINATLLLVYQFGIAALAGFGLDAIDKASGTLLNQIKNAPADLIHIKALALKVSLFIVSLAAISIAALYSRDELKHIQIIDIAVVKLICFVGAFLLLLNFTGGTRRRKSFLLGMVIAVQFFDLFLFGHNYNPQIKKDWVYPKPPPSITYMQKDKSLFRFAAFGDTFYPNSLMVYHISDIRGYEFPGNVRYGNYFITILKGSFVGSPGQYLFTNPAQYTSVYFEKVLKLSNVKYAASLSGYGGVQYKYFKSRAYLAHSVIMASSPGEAIIDIKKHINALLDDSVVIESKKDLTLPACPDMNGEYVTVDSYLPDTVKITVLNNCNAVLVLSDTYDSGWRVHVDGLRQPILHADYLFRGVILEPGLHRVVFRYKPLSFTLGLILSAVALLTTFIIVLL